MTMLRKAGMKIIPLFMAAITALSSVSMPVHAENTEVAGIAVEETKEQAQQSVILDENRKIISLSQVVKGVKVTVSAKPGNSWPSSVQFLKKQKKMGQLMPVALLRWILCWLTRTAISLTRMKT